MDRRRRKESSGSDATSNRTALHIDEDDARAALGREPLRLSPRAFAVLAYLARHVGRLVDKYELHRAVWRGAIVGDGALVVCIRELRVALGDDARRPSYIETVHRRGYRYIGAVRSNAESHAATDSRETRRLLGRAAPLAALEAARARAAEGQAQLVFVTGEAGIGKTTLVNAFLAAMGTDEPAAAAVPLAPACTRGQCIDIHGAMEPYLPLLEALDLLCREADGDQVIDLLEREAPSWLLQLPGAVAGDRYSRLQQRAHGTSQARMLRELAGALRALSLHRLVVMVLEDLHWSDPSTVNALSMLARRADPARLMIIGTYRPADLNAREHPLLAVRDELLAHGACHEIALDGWNSDAIADYLASRGPAGAIDSATIDTTVVDFIAHRTEGNPLFVSVVVDDLLESGNLTLDATGARLTDDAVRIRRRVPSGIGPLLMRLGERLPPSAQALLEAASVAGVEFSAACIAAAVARDLASVESELEHLASRGLFLRRAGVAHWPDGTLAARYHFIHALHQQSWYERLSPTSLQVFNLRIGARKEHGWRDRVAEIASELAGHFTDGQDFPRAVTYLRLAGLSAARRSAHQEATTLMNLGLALVKQLPAGATRDGQELDLRTALGPVLMASKGYGSREVESTYAAARNLSLRVGSTRQMFVSLYGLWSVYLVRPRHRVAQSIAERLSAIANAEEELAWQIEASWAQGCSSFLSGQLSLGSSQFERCIALYRRSNLTQLALDFGHDPGVSALSFGAWALWQQGLLDKATAYLERALVVAQDLRHPFSVAYAQTFGAWLHLQAQRYDEAQQLAAQGAERCAHYGLPQLQAMCEIVRGIAIATAAGINGTTLAHASAAIEEYRQSGGECLVPQFLVNYAEACAQCGRPDTGLDAIERALRMLDANEERWCEAEALRVRARLRLAAEGTAALSRSREDLAMALRVAEGQGSLLFSLRALMDMLQFLPPSFRAPDASSRLASVLDSFREGFSYPDLRRARKLAEEHRATNGMPLPPRVLRSSLRSIT